MNEPKPFAALTGSLLARKGAARPAMRPQISLDWMTPMPAPEAPAGGTAPEAQPEIDTAWTDMGPEVELPVTLVTESGPEAETETDASGDEADTRPEVLRQIAQLASVLDRKRSAQRAANADVEQLPGKKVAFTLRLDRRRHALLRACCTAEGRSAQALLVEALDRLVDATPGIEEVLARLPLPNVPLPNAPLEGGPVSPAATTGTPEAETPAGIAPDSALAKIARRR